MFLLDIDSQGGNAGNGNGGGLSISISGEIRESITSHTTLSVTNCDMQSNSAGGAGICFACEVIVTVVLFSCSPATLSCTGILRHITCVNH